ncbi:MAG TPA: hypothetical protein VJT49_28540 [Amycolatopsis sp.]|uniref:hypothetical protein n=1 Tax=Amycolatopsis sp. TaxID=37632 RepID=UPI002B45C66A|nr:hypothetical protein [Amycolatopsis sp.]HKS48986.1 hypothetical protein [Amycolatopsis sp.]
MTPLVPGRGNQSGRKACLLPQPGRRVALLDETSWDLDERAVETIAVAHNVAENTA